MKQFAFWRLWRGAKKIDFLAKNETYPSFKRGRIHEGKLDNLFAGVDVVIFCSGRSCKKLIEAVAIYQSLGLSEVLMKLL